VKCFGLVLGLLAALAVSPGGAQETGLAVGARAPAVTVSDLDGKTVDFAQYLGKQPLFLEWWATWCEQCDALLPRVRAAQAEVGDRVQFLGINVAVNQSPERVRRYVESNDVPFRTLYDDEGTSTRAYAAPTTSYVVIVDRAGRVAYTGTGGDQDFLGALRRVAAP
jgi:peroxiredoxin